MVNPPFATFSGGVFIGFHYYLRKKKTLREGILEAINVPLQVMKIANQSWEAVKEIAANGNMQCVSDVQVIFLVTIVSLLSGRPAFWCCGKSVRYAVGKLDFILLSSRTKDLY